MAAQDQAQYSVPVDFTGVDPWDPTKGGMTDPEPGAYTGKVVGSCLHVKDDGKKSIAVTVMLSSGVETTLYLGTDFSKAGNVRKLKTALLSCGMLESALGKVEVDPRWFMGKDGTGASCFVIVRFVDGVNAKGQKNLNDKEFATAAQFEAFNAAQGGSGGAGSNVPPPSQTANGAGKPPIGKLFG
jgi:hypothetical protein